MSAAPQVQGHVAVGSDDDGSVETETPKISFRGFTLALWYRDAKINGRHRDTIHSNALYYRPEYKEVTHSAIQQARIDAITTAYPTCNVCGGWRLNNNLSRVETWRYLPKEVFIAIGKFDINVHKYPEDELYISDHGRMANCKMSYIICEPNVTLSILTPR